MSVHAQLRADTRHIHEDVDQAFGSADLGRAAPYGEFLRKHGLALPPLERRLARVPGLPAFSPRLPMLTADLDALGIGLPEPLDPGPAPSLAEALGMLYVLEGSRLGGVMLSRQVGPGLPRSYLSAAHAKGEWRALLDRIEHLAPDAKAYPHLLAGAKRAFALYLKAAQTAVHAAGGSGT